MGVVKRQERGLIYVDNFDNLGLNSRWEVLPNDPARYTVGGGSLVLKHGDTPLYVFFTELTTIGEFVIDVKNEYNPTIGGDTGGIIVYTDGENFIKLEEYFDIEKGVANTYPWIRLVRSFHVYSAYWSEDGKTWRFIGNREVTSEVPKIGLFVEGGVEGQSFIADYVRIQRTTRAKVDNLKQGYKVDLLDEFGVILDTETCQYESTSVSFDLQRYGFPLTGNVAVTLPDGNRFESTEPLSIYGGDIYFFEPKLDLYYREYDEDGGYFDVKLQENQERFLGYMSSGQSVTENVLFLAFNNLTQGSFQDVTFELTASRGNQYQELVKLAPDVEGVPGAWSMLVNAIEITPEEPYKFWVRVERADTSTNYEAQVSFGMRVSSTYL